MLNLEQVKAIKEELYNIDILYGKLKAQVLMTAVPTYIFNHGVDDKLPPQFVRVEYDEKTKQLLELLSKQHCEAIKDLAKRYGIVIKDADDKEKMEAEPIKENKYIVNTIEEAIKTILYLMPPEQRQVDYVYDCKANQSLFSQSGEATLMIDRGDGIIAENIFSYKMKETGIFKEKGEQDESNTDSH